MVVIWWSHGGHVVVTWHVLCCLPSQNINFKIIYIYILYNYVYIYPHTLICMTTDLGNVKNV